MMNTRMTIADLYTAKQERRPIVAVSCYDCTTARLVSQAGADMILVGDTAAQFVLGYDSTLPVGMDVMVALTAGVRRGAPSVYLVADMPFLSYQVSTSEAIRNAGRFVVEADAQMVKIEATTAHINTIGAVSDAGIAVMAHIGIRPQRIATVGRLRAEATTADMAMELIELSEQMVRAGASMLLLEGVAAEAARIVTKNAGVPVISCGSGPGCDGQVLIAPDILGLLEGKAPKFAKAYSDIGPRSIEAFGRYTEEVRGGAFPDDDHSYHMKAGEIQRLETLLGSRHEHNH